MRNQVNLVQFHAGTLAHWRTQEYQVFCTLFRVDASENCPNHYRFSLEASSMSDFGPYWVEFQQLQASG